jgi:ankyrin repeat protein
MTKVEELHAAVKRGDTAAMKALLDQDRGLANSVSAPDPRRTYPLHMAAEFGQADAARMLVAYGADLTLLDAENDAIALCWAAFFGRPGVVTVLLDAGSEPSQRNMHGLTPLGCAVGGTEGRWRQFSNATIEDWQAAADTIRAFGGIE